VVSNGGRVLSVYYKKEKVEFWDVDLDKYSMVDLYICENHHLKKLGLIYQSMWTIGLCLPLQGSDGL